MTKITDETIARLYATARRYVAQAKEAGRKIEKPLCRFDDMVGEAVQWACMAAGDPNEIADKMLEDTWLRCLPTSAGYAGARFDPSAMAWAVKTEHVRDNPAYLHWLGGGNDRNT